jgi:hypothetical protein
MLAQRGGKEKRERHEPSIIFWHFPIWHFTHAEYNFISLALCSSQTCVCAVSLIRFISSSSSPLFFVSGLSVHSPSREKRSITFNEILQRIYARLFCFSFSSTRLGFGWAVGANPLFYFILFSLFLYLLCVRLALPCFFFVFFLADGQEKNPAEFAIRPSESVPAQGPKSTTTTRLMRIFESLLDIPQSFRSCRRKNNRIRLVLRFQSTRIRNFKNGPTFVRNWQLHDDVMLFKLRWEQVKLNFTFLKQLPYRSRHLL